VDAVRSQLSWFDRLGNRLGTVGDPADYGDLVLSHDGKRAAVSVLDPARNTRDLWIYDLAANRRERFTFDPASEFAPVWSPNNDSLAFSSSQKTNIDLYLKKINGADAQEPLLWGDLGRFAASWSRDGYPPRHDSASHGLNQLCAQRKRRPTQPV
jgi:WD40-like Beta Propeller Repeat